ncbi:MAG: hypothetical protein A2600_02535 [Candidatus Lambdaproteobacteria bacterium RIFOXYD1_FULL_56_27]|uniref:Uncharacterized protein n=1 Tax=Candidatus Lambdaproteobacteria bacterium RIFOXYD2_FULL_56_26 TaxID=1817773 RepID=A0A1F6H2Y2_9PROT|nr:MAG: hypothetical protein A2426_09575 [Candidatus Lambdaproteobacteria bacterium RIFOXYC1_FULL_56_13]OGH04654.1 MAG: hypothetical protein A2557_06600 [Candidatus Lambdaproteobacteria bacterium RIFOXYD2_FULL_56_26]OGH09118.1 MAG: hypothetical protein A2600_02535 [Candidatus Lambdaproteobacteria bacterium RIFOXYD1_FULL_56_27]
MSGYAEIGFTGIFAESRRFRNEFSARIPSGLVGRFFRLVFGIYRHPCQSVRPRAATFDSAGVTPGF